MYRKQPFETGILKISPLAIWHDLRVQYEWPIDSNWSAGSNFTVYYLGIDDLTGLGWKLEPFVRYYPKGKSPSGFYYGANAAAGQHRLLNFLVDYPDYYQGTTTITAFGLGAGGGWTYLKKHFAFDAYAGLQYYHIQNAIIRQDYFQGGNWYGTGPGAILNVRLMIGYVF